MLNIFLWIYWTFLSLSELSVQVFCLIFNWVDYLLLNCVVGPMSDYVLWILSFPYHLRIVVFQRADSLSVNGVLLITSFLLCLRLFISCLRNLCKSQDSLLVSSRSITVLAFMIGLLSVSC